MDNPDGPPADGPRVTILSAREGWHTDQLSAALRGRGATVTVRPYDTLVARLGRSTSPAPPAVAAPGVSVASSGSAKSAMSTAAAASATPVASALQNASAASRTAAASAGLNTPTVRRVPPTLNASGRGLGLDADAVLARIIPSGSLEQIIYRVDALHWLEESGVCVVNSPRAIERSVDKFYTSTLMEQAGLATPDTVVCERSEDAMAAFREMGDVIIKPLFGSMGLGMVRVSDEEIAWRVFRALDAIRGVYYVQRAIDHGGRDVRVFVVGGQVLGAIERLVPDGVTAASGSGVPWRTNYSRGGRARALDLSPEWAAAALRAAEAVGADYAGVDLLPGLDGTLYALEVNAIPGWQGLQTATGIDVAAAIANHVFWRLAHP